MPKKLEDVLKQSIKRKEVINMRLNNTGFFDYFMGVVFCVAVAGAILTPSHRINRATEKCVFYGGEETICREKAKAMTPDERLAYIRDTVESPSSGWMK
jgi:hypothetical protein